MMGIDKTQRKLRIPPKFIPYLEKHRIFELFYELAQFLIQEKPKDHLKFMRDNLSCAAASRDKPRIVFMAPPSFDRFAFAEQLVDELGIIPITRKTFMTPPEEPEPELPCCPEEEEEGRKSESWGSKKSYDRFLGREDQSLNLPSPPSGSVSAFEGEGMLLSKKSSEGDETEEETYRKKEMEKYYGIRVCPCKKVETQAEEVKESGLFGEVPGEDKKSVEGSEKEKEGAEVEEVVEVVEVEGEKSEAGEIELLHEQSEKGSKEETRGKQKKESKIQKIFGCREKGWILVDFPSNAQEAETLSKLGVIPTHALSIITDDSKWEQNRNYKCLARLWSKVYQGIPVTEIAVGQRSMDALVADLTKMVQIMPHRHPPMLPRIALIGSRGSGTATQAAKLVEKYGLVHVDFETITAQALQRDDDDDELSRRYKQQLTTEVDPEIEAAMLERAFLTPHCLKRGWVLTGYPRNLDQTRMLDLVAMPPNRIIFIDVPPKECFIRLYYRKYDPCTGTEYKIPNIRPAGLDDYTVHGVDSTTARNLRPHPKNDKQQIINDIENYFAEKQQMMEYCGKTASCIDGNKPVDTVFELIDQVLINSAPAQPPRKPLAASTDIFKAFIRLEELRKEAAAVSLESIA